VSERREERQGCGGKDCSEDRRRWEDGIRLDLSVREIGWGESCGVNSFGSGGGRLWTRWWIFGFWCRGISLCICINVPERSVGWHSVHTVACQLRCSYAVQAVQRKDPELCVEGCSCDGCHMRFYTDLPLEGKLTFLKYGRFVHLKRSEEWFTWTVPYSELTPSQHFQYL
jgi:hypothetical protein